ncbi:MAG TPA: pyridoxamine 5'-phosphate oxidase family protein [Solirubrobacterales bacterium]|nr:pyridoxamine 5'-phosphate oxidase family protein [Solirubrobacterales bacterium]
MGKIFERIDEAQREWIARQRLFFVGTAPLAADGRMNVSPKGPIGTLRVLDDHTVAYLDMVGSGAETVAHLRENGRIVVMLCAFEGPPRILRLHGRGDVIPADDRRFEELYARADFDAPHGIEAARRAVIVVEVERIADSCGYGVPLMSYAGERVHAEKWAEKKLRVGGEAAIDDYMAEKNVASIDGLPAFDLGRDRIA